MIAILVLHGVGIASDELDVGVLGAAVVIEVSGWILSRTFFRSWYQYPIDLDLMQVRWGVWVMIVVRSLLNTDLCSWSLCVPCAGWRSGHPDALQDRGRGRSV
jgi:hypothetical protein